ncbi:MAG: phosphate signaling complex protein PhoU [Thermoanaerobaculia bacterium]|nr:phosphate signaling complex protein PhoU [Thermoanaerobaculia bacterium]
MSTHLEVSLQHDLEQIRSKITEMGELAAKAIEASIRAVTERDRQLAFAVILRDQYIDEIEKQLDRLCLEFLVRHQPAASLLRFAYSAIKVNLELERVGDYAESIAREALRLTKVGTPVPVDNLKQIAALAVPMLRDAVRAFVTEDPELARRTIETDEAVDLMRDKLTADLTRAYTEGRLPFEALNPLVQATRRLERVSDQARNIGMETLYMCTGEYAKHPGSEAFRILFVDEHNSTLSLMAEAIGTSMQEAGFIFSSAGIDPAPVDTRVSACMAAKGFDISRSVPKAIIQVPNLDHYHVIVLLSPEVRRAFPRRPRRAVLLEWGVGSLPGADASDEEVTRACESTSSMIAGEIRDLVSAIRDTNS